MTTRKICLLLPLTLLTVSLTAGPAFATHKAWVLKNGGADCMFDNPDTTERNSGALTNFQSVARTAICPVALSGRWGSSSNPLFTMPRWAASKFATVYAYKAADILYCWAAAQSLSNTYYFSDSVIADGGVGPARITINHMNNWGGDLQTNKQVAIRSLDFACNIPGNHPNNGATSIVGYNVKICQLNPDCHDAQGTLEQELEEDEQIRWTDNQWNYVQTSGIECSPTESWDVSSLTRNFDGIKNTGTGPVSVTCPISPPADDSYFHNRFTRFTKVYYKGGSTGSSCVTSGTCPECYLNWWDKNGFIYQSLVFTPSTFGERLVEQPSSPDGGSDFLHMGAEVETAMFCYLPPGVTLNGIIGTMSLTYISGGQ
jgi:hypothetical protein